MPRSLSPIRHLSLSNKIPSLLLKGTVCRLGCSEVCRHHPTSSLWTIKQPAPRARPLFLCAIWSDATFFFPLPNAHKPQFNKIFFCRRFFRIFPFGDWQLPQFFWAAAAAQSVDKRKMNRLYSRKWVTRKMHCAACAEAWFFICVMMNIVQLAVTYQTNGVFRHSLQLTTTKMINHIDRLIFQGGWQNLSLCRPETVVGSVSSDWAVPVETGFQTQIHRERGTPKAFRPSPRTLWNFPSAQPVLKSQYDIPRLFNVVPRLVFMTIPYDQVSRFYLRSLTQCHSSDSVGSGFLLLLGLIERPLKPFYEWAVWGGCGSKIR